MTHSYDVASRLSGLKVGGTDYASQIVYSAASQTTSLKVGASGANQITESYGYGAQTGLLESQTVMRGATKLLDLAYDYAGANGKRTGQLVKITNQTTDELTASHRKDRNYEYDALGRLVKATGGATPSPIWTENYSYDQYGNRLGVTSSGNTAKLEKPVEPEVKLPTAELAMQTDPGKPDQIFSSHGIVSDSENGIRLPAGREAARVNTTSSAAPSPQSTPVFTDDPLVAGVTTIKAVHITELRDAINQLRTRAGLPAATWTDTQLAGTIIKAAHITELRARLNEARTALGLSNPAYTDPTLTANSTTIKAAHITELRDRFKAAWTTSSQVPRDGIASLSYEVASNRISTAGYEYDAAGNLTRSQSSAGGWQRFEYDPAGRLVSVKTDSNVLIASYTYGSSNQRLITTEGSLKTYYAWAGDATIAEYTEVNSSGVVQWSKSYVYLGARLLATLQLDGNGGEFTQYHHPDRLGTRLITNASDTTVQEQVTLPFGTALDAESTGSTNRRFTSYDRSISTGLDYAVNRHYDSMQGRFTQVDPIGMSASSLNNPQTLNLYAYCGNDPINHADPSGLFWGKLWRGIKKILSNKWVQIAIAVAIIVIAHYYPNSIFGFGGSASSAGRAAPVLHAATTTGAATGAAGAAARAAAVAFWNTFSVAELEGVVAGAGLATATSLALTGALTVGLVASGGQGGWHSGQQQTQVKCPGFARKFFDTTLGILRSIAETLDVTPILIITHASFESGWLDAHNRVLNNLFGYTRAGGLNQRFKSLQAAADKYVEHTGPAIRGSKTVDEFLDNLGKAHYNSDMEKYGKGFKARLDTVKKFGGPCGASL